jgi:MFS family permease
MDAPMTARLSRRLPWVTGFIVAAALCDGTAVANHLTTVLWLDNAQHVRPDILGLLAVVSSIVYVSVVAGMGHVADRIGSRRMACAGAVVMALSNLCMAVLGAHRPALVLGLAGKGLAAAMFWPALAGWLGRGASPSVLPRRLTAYNIGWCGGQVVGLSAAGILYQQIGAPCSYYVYLAFSVGLGVLVLRLPEPRLADGGEEDAPPVRSSRGRRVDAWLANFAGFFVLSELRSLFAQYGQSQLGLTPATAGLCMAFVMVVQFALFWYLGLVRPELARGGWLRPAQALTVVGMAAMAALRGTGALLALPAIGLLVGVANTASLYHSVSGRDDAARQSGVHETVLGVAQILGPLLGGLAAAHIAPSAPWWLGAIVTAIALAAAMVLQKKDV